MECGPPLAGPLEPAITGIQRLRIEPGDRLVVHANKPALSQQEATEIQHRLRATLGLPDGFPVAVLAAGVSLEVVNAP